MTATLLSGQDLAQMTKSTLNKTIEAAAAKAIRPPSLAVILVGQDEASSVYVRHKQRACLEVGIVSKPYFLPFETTTQKLIAIITELNHHREIDGILVQLPLPPHINTQAIIETIRQDKDVDGFHPYNLGRLALNKPALRPCTPCGIIQLLAHHHIDIKGKDATIIGASNIVGRPMMLELLNARATPTICHRDTQSLQKHVENAELLIVATGVLDVVPMEWLHEKHIIIDVGIHRLGPKGLRGDIDFQKAQTIVKAITPVPGGVGPMTVATLLANTVSAWQSHVGL